MKKDLFQQAGALPRLGVDRDHGVLARWRQNTGATDDQTAPHVNQVSQSESIGR